MTVVDSGTVTARQINVKKELAARLVWQTLKHYRELRGSEMALSSPAWKEEWTEICCAMRILLDEKPQE